MKFQEVADSIAAMTSIMSVEKKEDGGYGDIRIVTGNEAYISSIEQPQDGITMLNSKFVPNSIYTDYIQRDLIFEEFCYRAAVEKKCLHSYAHPERFDVWFNMTFMPLWPDDGNICYCTYTMEISRTASSETMSNVSSDIASAVVDATVKLRGTTDFKVAMQDVIRDVRKLCETEYCCILLVDDEEQRCEVLCEDFADGVDLAPMDSYLDEDFYSIAKTWDDTISGSSCLIAKNEHGMQVVKERNPVWYKSLTDAGVYNIALFPLRTQNETLGYMWSVNFDSEQSTKIKETLELATFILGSEIGNYLSMKRLKILSSRDMLTGVMNRNEMNNYVDELADRGTAADRDVAADGNAAADGSSKESGGASNTDQESETIGVIYADLNGLKPVNDNEGHEAGDRMLRNAADALRSVFPAEEIFRAGGDEFVVISIGLSAAELEEKAASIKKNAEKYNVSFAIGSAIAQSAKDLRKALVQADEGMYEDKKRYYEEHLEKKKR